jgi:hypothetical protein
MPRACSCCTSPKRDEINAAIVGRVPKSGIAREFRVSADSVERHAKGHLPKAIVRARAAAEVLSADALVRQMSDLQARTLKLLDDAERDSDGRLCAVAIHQARENAVTVGRLIADLREKGLDESGEPRKVIVELRDTENWRTFGTSDVRFEKPPSVVNDITGNRGRTP